MSVSKGQSLICDIEKLCQIPIILHSQVAKKNLPNFLGARIQVNFNFNHDLYATLLQDYWGWQIPMFMRYGFPIGFVGDRKLLTNDRVAHPSALEYPEHVDYYLQDECNMKAIFGPMSEAPFANQTHTSPFITRAKLGSDKRRVIIDLSWPIGASVNDFTPETSYMGNFYKLKITNC